MAVGLKTLELLSEIPKTYQILETLGESLETGLKNSAQKNKVPLQVNRVGSMFSFFFSENPVTDVEGVKKSDAEMFRKVFHHLLDNGIMIAPSPFESGFISLAHTHENIEKTVGVFEKALYKESL